MTATSTSKQTKRYMDRCGEQPAGTRSLLCTRILQKNIPENKHTPLQGKLDILWSELEVFKLTLNIAFFLRILNKQRATAESKFRLEKQICDQANVRDQAI